MHAPAVIYIHLPLSSSSSLSNILPSPNALLLSVSFCHFPLGDCGLPEPEKRGKCVVGRILGCQSNTVIQRTAEGGCISSRGSAPSPFQIIIGIIGIITIHFEVHRFTGLYCTSVLLFIGSEELRPFSCLLLCVFERGLETADYNRSRRRGSLHQQQPY